MDCNAPLARSLLSAVLVVFTLGGAPTSQDASKTSSDAQGRPPAMWDWDSGMGETTKFGSIPVWKHDAEWGRAVATFQMELEELLKGRGLNLPGQVQDSTSHSLPGDEYEIAYAREGDEALPGLVDGIDARLRVRVCFNFQAIMQVVVEVEWRRKRSIYKEWKPQVISHFYDDLRRLIVKHQQAMSALPME